MTSRERLRTTLDHQSVDRVCVDFGATAVTGISVHVVARLRARLLGDPDYRVKVIEPYQMLGEIDDELAEALGVDVMGVYPPKTMFGFPNTDWKPFALFDGTPVLVPGQFQVSEGANGDLVIYPEGDTAVPPSGRMPHGGYFFDAIPRQDPIVEDLLDPRDNLEEFAPLTEEEVQHYLRGADATVARQKGSIMGTPGTAFGDIALVPALWRKRVRGIRDVEEWYVSTATRRDYVYRVFEGQCSIALKNLDRLMETLGDRIQVAFVTGTDFGTQSGLFISRKAYRDLYLPFHQQITRHIHAHSTWKVFIHSCGSVAALIPDFIEAGFDILNPVQCSAAGMDPRTLKRVYGRDLVFWGGGVDTQHTLPNGTPEEVYREVRERISIFNDSGGYVFNTVHNIQGNVPIDNIIAMLQAIRDSVKG